MNRPPLGRRDLLRIGSLGAVGLSLPDLLRGAESAGVTTGKAKSCVLFFLDGGPAHQDTWDMKPDAPENIRGEFKPIASTIPGVPVCEYLPMVAQQMHHLALIRAVHHQVVDHNASCYYMLTGRSPVSGGTLIRKESPDNFPCYGAVLARMRATPDLPDFVHIPEIMFNCGGEIPGELAGFLGPGFDPLGTGDPSAPEFRIPGLTFPEGSSAGRLSDRRSLLGLLDRSAGHLQDRQEFDRLDTHYQKAFSLLGTQRTRDAFDITQESAGTRERYGLPVGNDRKGARNYGGLPHLGQCLLLSRRLVEAGVRLVTVCTGRRYDQTWDGHREHFALMKKSILPYFDRAFSAFMEDMHQRGLLDETLVVVMGEFGRTPQVGQITSSAGASEEGRDHWPHCYTIMMAGAGVKAGMTFGASDRFAAYPASNPVTPEDVAATIYHALGVDPRMHILDPLNRPFQLALGEPILDVFA
ncbi:MAG: DUF1501 domain-containing protein [Planctomycetaceae bacterium]